MVLKNKNHSESKGKITGRSLTDSRFFKQGFKYGDRNKISLHINLQLASMKKDVIHVHMRASLDHCKSRWMCS